MNTDVASSFPPSRSMAPDGNADDGVLKLQGSHDRSDGDRFASVTIPIPKEIHQSLSYVSSTLYNLVPVEGHHITSIFTVLFVETVFLKCVGWSGKEVLSALFFTALLGRFAWPVWCNLILVHHRLEDVFGRIEALQQSIKSLELAAVARPPIEYIPVPTVPVFPREEPTSEPLVKPKKKRLSRKSEQAVVPPVEPPTPYKISTPKPIPSAVDNPSPVAPPAAPWSEPVESVVLEGWDNIAEIPEVHTPVVPPVVIKNPSPPATPTAPSPDPVHGVSIEGMDNMIRSEPEIGTEQARLPTLTAADPPPSIPSAPSTVDRGEGVQLEGMENIFGGSRSSINTADGPAEQEPVPETETPTQDGFRNCLPLLRGIKLRIEQATEGKIQRISHQGQLSILLSLSRWVIRLLMSAASLSPANFAPPNGFLGPSESTPYYPTGDLQGDRSAAFSVAMDCIDDLEAHLQGDDITQIATRLFELAQALNDLGLRDYALSTSGFALDALEGPYNAETNNYRLHVASILSLRSNILCDLKQNDEARDAAARAVTLCEEQRDSQAAPVPELAYALVNHATLLCSMGLNDESAAVAVELLCQDEARPDMKDIFALCRLCFSMTRVGADDGMDMEAVEQAIESTRTSLDANSQAVLAGALLAKGRILSSGGQSDAASAVSAEAVTLLRSMSAARPVFSLFLAHALDTHANNLSEANHRGESYSVRRDAVELWRTLKTTAGSAVMRPLAWSLFELSKFRHRGDRDALREELQLAEDAVAMFREVEPIDFPGLGDALYLYADRMLELDKNQEAVTYAEESIHYFREASNEDPKYALDLIFSLSLASACLACTERDDYAFEYAKQAVEVQRGRIDLGDKQYDAHLRKLLMDVVFRATEMDKQEEAAPWQQELQILTGGEGFPLARRSGKSQDDQFRKQTSYWLDENADGPKSNDASSSSTPAASSSVPRVDKGKGKEVAPSPAWRSPTPLVDKVDAPFDSSVPGHRVEQIMTPGAAAATAAQRRQAGLGNSVSMQGNAFEGGSGGSRHMGGPSMGGRTLGGSELGGGLGVGSGLDGMGGLGGLSGARGGSSSRSSSISRPGSSSRTVI